MNRQELRDIIAGAMGWEEIAPAGLYPHVSWRHESHGTRINHPVPDPVTIDWLIDRRNLPPTCSFSALRIVRGQNEYVWRAEYVAGPSIDLFGHADSPFDAVAEAFLAAWNVRQKDQV